MGSEPEGSGRRGRSWEADEAENRPDYEAAGLTILGGGWIYFSAPLSPAREPHDDFDESFHEPVFSGVFARLVPASDGQLEVCALHIARRSRITPDQLREIRVGQIETLCNFESARSRIVERENDEPPNFAQWAEFAEAAEAELNEMRARSRSPFKIQIPEGRGRYPDRFYREVVAAYAELALRQRAPARALAELNEIPVTTVHRWLKEARRRGLMFSPTWKGRHRGEHQEAT
jgi:hypothetical protein